MPAPVISVAQMRQWEHATWAAGRTEAEVISRVGHIVCLRARQLTRPGDLILVLAGKGHNGDDARHASQNFSDREVYLINVSEPEAALKEFESQLSLSPALAIDGLFGIGLNRGLDKHWAKLIEGINASGVPVLAIDVPSGLHAGTGEPQGAAIRASITLTLGAPKNGLLEASAWPFVGRLEVVPDIGLVALGLDSDVQWTLAEDFAAYPPRRPVAAHKGSLGHVCIFAGSTGYHGAAVLAARGALRARPGLVTLYTSHATYGPAASQLQQAMVHPWKAGQKLPDTCTAILCGPGLADPKLDRRFRLEVVRLWSDAAVPVIADASALDWLPPRTRRWTHLRVITPHPGEAARLLKRSSAAVQADRQGAAAELSKKFGASFVVLKGHQSIIARQGEKLFVNSSGNPDLAQGGSGDVLSGYLAGLLAQPLLNSDALRTIRRGVWQHGAAADHLSARSRNWCMDELLNVLGTVELAESPFEHVP